MYIDAILQGVKELFLQQIVQINNTVSLGCKDRIEENGILDVILSMLILERKFFLVQILKS